MKKTLFALFAVGALSLTISHNKTALAQDAEYEPSISCIDEYDFSLNLKVPQVFDNTESKGYRKYRSQNIRGKMLVNWLQKGGFFLEFRGLENRNFLVRGENVRYIGTENKDMVNSRFNWIGSNRSEIFKTPCVCFYLELEPSYAIGGNTEDNSFWLLLSGKGNSTDSRIKGTKLATMFKGYAAGTQGCGCMAYGHKSPTRKGEEFGPSVETEDVVATFGSWTARWKKRLR